MKHIIETNCEYWLDNDGRLHRDNEPAYISNDGSQYWYQHGRLHREKEPAIINQDGEKIWYYHGQYHRIGGPAIMFSNGDWEYYQYDALHRLDGPATYHKDDYLWHLDISEWWINGERILCKDNEEFLRIVKMKELL
jgi:hypothetical protein